MFFGRRSELENLRRFYEDPSARIACIYGRLGMGKSSLIRYFLQDKPHIYFCAYSTTGAEEMSLFARVTGVLEESDPTKPCVDRLRQLLEKVGADAAASTEGTFVLAIDNYPGFARADAGFDKVLHDFILKGDSSIKLIICGDSYLQMQKLVFDKKSVWHNALDLCFELGGLGYYESSEFLTEVTDSVDKAFIYGMTGGIPTHLKRAAGDVRRSIDNIFFKDNEAALLPERTMQTELRELSYYNHILCVLASGFNRVNQISASVDKPKDVVVPYMTTLMGIGMVTKENPVTEKTNRKKTRYSIVNSFDSFWYRFFAPHMDLFYTGEVDELIDSSIMPGRDAFMRSVFISMCREYLERRSGAGLLPFTISEIGNWWQNDDENMTTQGFDLVSVGSMGDEDAMMFGRCYYTDEPVGISTLKELIDLTKQVKGKKNVFYLVFSKSGFHENTTTVAATIKNIILVSLEDIVNG